MDRGGAGQAAAHVPRWVASLLGCLGRDMSSLPRDERVFMGEWWRGGCGLSHLGDMAARCAAARKEWFEVAHGVQRGEFKVDGVLR